MYAYGRTALTGVAVISLAAAWCHPSHFAIRVYAQTAATESRAQAFDVTSVKPANPADHRWRLDFGVDDYLAENVSLLQVIQQAYGVPERDRIAYSSKWIGTQRFDIRAKSDGTSLTNLSLDKRQGMLQSLLQERFRLVAHFEKQPREIYALVIAKRGSKLNATPNDRLPGPSFTGFRARVTRSRAGQVTIEGCTMTDLAHLLSGQVARYVQDDTGLTGHYNINLTWRPDPSVGQSLGNDSRDADAEEMSGPSIYSAVEEQLGLSLKPESAPVDVLVIDRVEEPSPD